MLNDRNDMTKDSERSQRIVHAMKEAGFDALICALPKNVLLLTGYYPIIGSAIAIARNDGHTTLIAPKDEREYYTDCGADEIIEFSPGSLEALTTALDVIRTPLQEALKGLERATIGLEGGSESVEASYVAMTLYEGGLAALVHELLPATRLQSSDAILARERSVLTTIEQTQLRTALDVARNAYRVGVGSLGEGTSEAEAAQHFQVPLWAPSPAVVANRLNLRAHGRIAIMSGRRSGSAYGSFAMSSYKQLAQNELVLVHCNSHADGYWTDITRTYFLGAPSERIHRMYEAVLTASKAGIQAVKPGVAAATIDAAVRECLTERGFGEQFKHGTGHGVGFSAIDHNAIPRLHPKSPDTLEVGMVMNIEPGIYFEDFGGMRHCDMVVVTEDGCELLTPFHNQIDELVLEPVRGLL